MKEMRISYKMLHGTPEGKRQLRRRRRMWIIIIKNNLTELGFRVVDWINLVQDFDRWLTVVIMTGCLNEFLHCKSGENIFHLDSMMFWTNTNIILLKRLEVSGSKFFISFCSFIPKCVIQSQSFHMFQPLNILIRSYCFKKRGVFWLAVGRNQ